MKILFAKMKVLLLLVAAFLGYHLGVANAAAIHETTSTRQTTITNSSTSKNWPRMQVKKEKLEMGECPYKPQCTWDYANYELTLSCTNFTYFNELNFTTANNTRIFDRIRIIPLKEQELTENNLNLEGLSIHSLGTIELANINKFYYRSNPLSRLNNAEKRFTLILKLVNCTFTFAYDHRTALNSVCNSNLINATQENRSHSLMSSANSVHIEGAKFVEPICPFLFHNVKMSNLYVTNPREHSFRFLDVQLDSRLIGPEANVKDVENTTVLNCRLRYLTFNGVTFTSFDFGVLSKFVFYNVRSMTFRNVVFKLINEKVFSNFPYLNQIELNPANWEYFVANTNLDVLFRNLNSKPTHVDFNNTKAKVDLKSKISLHLDARSSQYDFPDSDFCRFAHFPFDLLVRTFVYTRDNNCTCTIKWLDQYAGKYPSDTDYGRSAGANCRKKTDCDFEALGRTCTVRQEKLVTASESNFNIRPLVNALLITVVVVFLVFVFVIVFRRVRAPPRRRAAATAASRRRPSKQSDSFQISYSVDNEETVLNRSDIPVTPDSTVIVGSSSKRTPAPGSKVVRKSKFYRAGQN